MRVRLWASAHVCGLEGAGTPWVPSGLSAGVRGVGGPARECECVSARVRARARSAGAGCHGNTPRPELIISCGKCAGGAERGGPRRRRRGAASRWLAGPRRAPGAAATPGSCLRQAGESGAGAGWGRPGRSGTVRPLLGALRPGPPCPRDPLPGPAVGRGGGRGSGDPVLRGHPAGPRALQPEPRTLSRAGHGWGGTSARIGAASGPPFRFPWPGKPDPTGEPRVRQRRPLPLRRSPAQPGLP